MIAEKEGFIIIYPQGNIDSSITNHTCWNAGECCCQTHDVMDPRSQRVNIDDSGFLLQAISNTINTTKETMNIIVNKKRIYFAGHSNGCMMGQSMAIQHSNIVAAVCCHAGILVNTNDIPYDNYNPTPIQTVMGDLDMLVPFNHTTPWGTNSLIQNAVQNFEFWGTINNCTNKTTTVDDNNIYKTHTYSECMNNATIQMLQVLGAGHWPYKGINLSNSEIALKIVNTAVDTTMLSWDFCSRYMLDVDPTLPNPVPYVTPYSLLNDIDYESSNNIASSQPITTTMKNDGWNISTNILPGFLLVMYFIARL